MVDWTPRLRGPRSLCLCDNGLLFWRTILWLRIVARLKKNQVLLTINLGQSRSDGAVHEGSSEQLCSARSDVERMYRLISKTVLVEGLTLRHRFVQPREDVAVPECLLQCSALRIVIGRHRNPASDLCHREHVTAASDEPPVPERSQALTKGTASCGGVSHVGRE